MFTTAWGFPVGALGPRDRFRTRCTALFFLCGSQCWVDSSLGPEFCVGLDALLREIMGYGIAFVLLVYISIYFFLICILLVVIVAVFSIQCYFGACLWRFW